jgi:hypothetical protein
VVESKKDWNLPQSVRSNRASAFAKSAPASGPGVSELPGTE